MNTIVRYRHNFILDNTIDAIENYWHYAIYQSGYII